MGDIKSFASLVEKVKSEESPYFTTGSATGLQDLDWINTSGTHYFSRQIYASSIDRGVKRNFRIEPKRVQPEPIKVWVISRHIAYFDPKTSTYHTVSMMKSTERQWLANLVFNIMSIFI